MSDLTIVNGPRPPHQVPHAACKRLSETRRPEASDARCEVLLFFIYNDYLHLVQFVLRTVVLYNLSICLCLVASKKNGNWLGLVCNV